MKNKWRIFISESARKDFYNLDLDLQKRIKLSLNELKENPFKKRSKTDIKKLKGAKNPAFYRLRVGNCRIIYTVEVKEVKITRILPRKKAYSWLD